MCTLLGKVQHRYAVGLRGKEALISGGTPRSFLDTWTWRGYFLTLPSEKHKIPRVPGTTEFTKHVFNK